MRLMLESFRRGRATAAPGSSRTSRFLLGCGLVFGCVFVGMTVAVLPYWFVIAVAVVPIFFLLVAWRIDRKSVV